MKLKSNKKEDQIKFTFINCLCCGKNIELLDFAGKNPTPEDMENYLKERYPFRNPNNSSISFNASGRQYDPKEQTWNSGDIFMISAGYGSRFDGTMVYAGICDDCIENGINNARLRYYGNYIGGSLPLKELQKLENLRHREENLNKLLGKEYKEKQ